MSFHASAQDIRVDDGHILRARLQKADGETADAEINLNDFIGNDNGSFEWGGQNFSESAEDISFSLEGDDEVPILRAGLRNVDGELVHSDLNLSERIGNNDGSFTFE